jgi:Tfp pilus assembly protein PilV
MPLDLKLQIFFAVLLCAILIGLVMILTRTLAGLEYAMNRIEELMSKELSLARQQLDRETEAAKKAATHSGRRSRNDLLLNIPFMDRLHKEKQKGGA